MEAGNESLMIDRGLFEAQAVPGRLNFLMRLRKAQSSGLQGAVTSRNGRERPRIDKSPVFRRKRKSVRYKTATRRAASQLEDECGTIVLRSVAFALAFDVPAGLLGPAQTAGVAEGFGAVRTLLHAVNIPAGGNRTRERLKDTHLAPFRRICPPASHAHMLFGRRSLQLGKWWQRAPPSAPCPSHVPLRTHLFPRPIVVGVWHQARPDPHLEVRPPTVRCRDAEVVRRAEKAVGRSVQRLRLHAELRDALLEPLVLHLELEKRVQPATFNAPRSTVSVPHRLDKRKTVWEQGGRTWRCCGWGTAGPWRSST